MAVKRELPAEIEALLDDPQTSGGLLISLPEADAATLEKSLPDVTASAALFSSAKSPSN